MFRGSELRRVVVAPPQDDPEIRVLTAELYADGLIVRYVLMDDSERALEQARALVRGKDVSYLKVRDDLGTEYEPEGGLAGGVSGGTLHGQEVFTPTVPDDARKIIVVTWSDEIEIEVPGVARGR